MTLLFDKLIGLSLTDEITNDILNKLLYAVAKNIPPQQVTATGKRRFFEACECVLYFVVSSIDKDFMAMLMLSKRSIPDIVNAYTVFIDLCQNYEVTEYSCV
jgi:hypothetical protein